jgi:hypothetical protein
VRSSTLALLTPHPPPLCVPLPAADSRCHARALSRARSCAQPRFRSLWERYCRGVQAIVFVVDAADHEAVQVRDVRAHVCVCVCVCVCVRARAASVSAASVSACMCST